VFTSQPQAVEVYERGGWLPASMLGWRHDSDGACSAWVRVEFAGVVEDAWVELTRLRLPESPARHLSLARAPKGTAAAPVTGAADPSETQQLPLVREGGAPPVGRRVPPGGGRRRAPETGDLAASSPSTPSPSVPSPATPSVVDEGAAVPGRHRAPAEQGRHRAIDTGMHAAVPTGAPRGVPAAVPGPRDGSAPIPAADRWPPTPARSELPPAGPVVRALDLDAERLTRPMRLDEGVGTVRRSRRDSLSV
jgi:hypothetical protein